MLEFRFYFVNFVVGVKEQSVFVYVPPHIWVQGNVFDCSSMHILESDVLELHYFFKGIQNNKHIINMVVKQELSFINLLQNRGLSLNLPHKLVEH